LQGDSFGTYQLIELLGRGGMGEVWRAHDTVIDRVVAIKILPAEISRDEVFQQRFRREAHAAARLNSPHIVPIHTHGEIDGRLFVDMRLVEGRNLQSMLDSGPLPPPRAVRIVEQIAKALQSAHKVGLLHRDVKPSNVLIDEDDYAYLIDFGIALPAGERGLTTAGDVIGTFHYMAPERFKTQEPGAPPIDARSDIYALACVLYECLTAEHAYPGDSLEQQIGNHLVSPPPRPSKINPALPRGFDAVIGRGMAKKPTDRFESAVELARAAREALSTPPSTQQARKPTGPYHMPPARVANYGRRQAAPPQPPPPQPPPPPPVTAPPQNAPPKNASTADTVQQRLFKADLAQRREPPPAVPRQEPDVVTRREPPAVPPRREPLADCPPVAPRPPPSSPTRQRPVPPWWRRKSVVISGTALLTVAAVVVTTMAVLGDHRPKHEDSRQTTLPFTGLHGPQGLTVDKGGTVYVADTLHNKILSLPPGSTTPTVLPFDGLSFPTGVTTDNTGAVYVNDAGNKRVVVIPAGAKTQNQLAFTDLGNPTGLTVDSAHTVYVTDTAKNRVVALEAGTNRQYEIPFTGLSAPTGLTLANSGTFYVADGGNHRVLSLPPGSSQTALPFVGLSDPGGVTLDSEGAVYVTSSNNKVLKLPAGSTQQVELPFTGLDYPWGLAVDGDGTVYVAGQNNKIVALRQK